MLCMELKKPGSPLVPVERELPSPGPGQVLLKIKACGVCRTDLHLIDGELPDIAVPIVPGHEIVGEVADCGSGVQFEQGTRLGVPWLGYTCGSCFFCRHDQENLCDSARFTGYQVDGGYSQYTVADHRYCFAIPLQFSDIAAAPLLCAGLIGYRSLRMTGDSSRIGIYGFGAAAHIIAQVAVWQGKEIYAFVRPGDNDAKNFALELGAAWAGDSSETPPRKLDAAILFAPVGELVPLALRNLRKGGIVVCGGIHMSDIPQFPYEILWGERVIRSVANLTRRDAEEFLEIAPQVPVKTHTETFPLIEANEALARLRSGQLTGAAVLIP